MNLSFRNDKWNSDRLGKEWFNTIKLRGCSKFYRDIMKFNMKILPINL